MEIEILGKPEGPAIWNSVSHRQLLYKIDGAALSARVHAYGQDTSRRRH